jgi:hypothetical protein
MVVASVEVILLQLPGGAEKIHVEPKPGKTESLAISNLPPPENRQ